VRGNLFSLVLLGVIALSAGAVILAGLLLTEDPPAPKPQWFLAGKDTIKGQPFNLVCTQRVSRKALVRTDPPEKLREGDTLQTICVATRKGPSS
jgi:hypothetical protein